MQSVRRQHGCVHFPLFLTVDVAASSPCPDFPSVMDWDWKPNSPFLSLYCFFVRLLITAIETITGTEYHLSPPVH